MDFSEVRVLVLGDVMLDHYITGGVQRISPEAPVPVVHVGHCWSVPGGAANVARNLARLGVDVRLLGLAGEDASGDELCQSLAAEGIDNAIIRTAGRRTTRKTRILSQGQQLLRLDEEDFAPPSSEESRMLLEKTRILLEGCGALVLSDYAKGVLASPVAGESLCGPVIREARRQGIPVLVDPKGSQWGRYANAQCVTPNQAEFLAEFSTEEAPRTRQDYADLAARICAQHGFDHLLLTRGAKGMALFPQGGEPCYLRAVAREVADVSGAGDTVIAVLAACIARGFSWAESARIANTAAGLAVAKVGTAPVSLHELATALQEQAENPKLYSPEALCDKLEEWRRKNETIVFTNGCFDLLHPGHISLIRQCVGLGDRLVVGLNSDASVRRLKGSTRPIQNEQSRALLLAALQGVDAVVLFGEDTPLDLIRQVRPDVLVKGSDYSEDRVVGADFVKSYGGSVHLAELVDGCSTTGLARRIAGR